MSSEIRRGSADDPGETADPASAPDNTAGIHMANPLLSRQELKDLPDYDGEVPPPLEGADPGNEDIGEPADITGLGHGYHGADELRAWLAARAAGDGRVAEDDQAAPAEGSDDPEGTEQARPGAQSTADTVDEHRGRGYLDGNPAPEERNPSPEGHGAVSLYAETGQQSDSPSATSPDRNAEDPMAALEQRMLRAMERRDAEHKAEIDALRVQHQKETDHLKAEIDELRANDKTAGDRLDEVEAKLRPVPTSEPNRGKELDQAKTGEGSDLLPDAAENDPDGSGIASDQGTLLDQRKESVESADRNLDKPPRWRRVATADNVSAAGTVINAANTVAEFAMHATADGIASLGITALSLAALALGKFEKHRKDKE